VIAPEDYAVETIGAAITAVTTQSSYRAAAERVRDEIAAMPSADAAWAGITF
jgi:UDP:flavonoid glycosyltransferase YjiC (YdhE family)